MNRLFRLLRLILRARWASRCPPLGPCTTRLRVWPNDLDLFLHVNNGVYLTLCDLARVDLMLRSGTLGLASGKGRVFLVAGETIQLYRPLSLFQRFEIETRVVGWDEKAFFVEHRFWITRGSDGRGGDGAGEGREIVAHALVEGRVQDRQGRMVAPDELLAHLGLPADPPALPEWVERWRQDQRALRRATRSEPQPKPPSS